jgi:hypothetical protein
MIGVKKYNHRLRILLEDFFAQFAEMISLKTKRGKQFLTRTEISKAGVGWNYPGNSSGGKNASIIFTAPDENGRGYKFWWRLCS